MMANFCSVCVCLRVFVSVYVGCVYVSCLWADIASADVKYLEVMVFYCRSQHIYKENERNISI